MSDAPVEVRLSRCFVKDAKKLAKKYRQVADDIETLIARLEQGETPGDPIAGVEHTTFKVRLKSSDLTRGKSGGFRIIYYYRVRTRIILITIYVKARRENISSTEIATLIREHEDRDISPNEPGSS